MLSLFAPSSLPLLSLFPISVSSGTLLSALLSSPIANQYSHASIHLSARPPVDDDGLLRLALADIGFPLPRPSFSHALPSLYRISISVIPFPSSFLPCTTSRSAKEGCLVYFHIFRLTCCTVHRLPSVLEFKASQKSHLPSPFRPSVVRGSCRRCLSIYPLQAQPVAGPCFLLHRISVGVTTTALISEVKLQGIIFG